VLYQSKFDSRYPGSYSRDPGHPLLTLNYPYN